MGAERGACEEQPVETMPETVLDKMGMNPLGG